MREALSLFSRFIPVFQSYINGSWLLWTISSESCSCHQLIIPILERNHAIKSSQNNNDCQRPDAARSTVAVALGVLCVLPNDTTRRLRTLYSQPSSEEGFFLLFYIALGESLCKLEDLHGFVLACHRSEAHVCELNGVVTLGPPICFSNRPLLVQDVFLQSDELSFFDLELFHELQNLSFLLLNLRGGIRVVLLHFQKLNLPNQSPLLAVDHIKSLKHFLLP